VTETRAPYLTGHAKRGTTPTNAARRPPGRPPGSGRRYPTRESYVAAIHERVYAKADAQRWDLWCLPAWRIADMLGISERSMYERNAEHGLTLDTIRSRCA
jgi:hypothetical protein